MFPPDDMAFKLKESRGEAKLEMERYLTSKEWENAAVKESVETTKVLIDLTGV